MDITKIIKDNLPDGVEIGEKTISIVAKAINVAVGEETVPKTAYAKQSEKVVALESRISEIEGGLADAEAYKTKITELELRFKEQNATHKDAIVAKEAELADFKAQVDGEKAISAKRGKAREWLISKGMTPDVADDFMLDKIDYAAIVTDESGGIKDADMQMKPYQEKYGKYFGTTTVKGPDIAMPPHIIGGEKNPWSKENRNLAEQTRIFRDAPDKAREMARVAGVILD